MLMTIFKHLWIPMLIGVYLYGWIYICIKAKKEFEDEKDYKDIRNGWLFMNFVIIFIGSIICFAKC